MPSHFITLDPRRPEDLPLLQAVIRETQEYQYRTPLQLHLVVNPDRSHFMRVLRRHDQDLMHEYSSLLRGIQDFLKGRTKSCLETLVKAGFNDWLARNRAVFRAEETLSRWIYETPAAADAYLCVVSELVEDIAGLVKEVDDLDDDDDLDNEQFGQQIVHPLGRAHAIFVGGLVFPNSARRPCIGA